MHPITRIVACQLAVSIACAPAAAQGLDASPAAAVADREPAAQATDQLRADARLASPGRFVVGPLGIINLAAKPRALTFGRCVWGQGLQGRRCAGEAIESTAAELFSRQTRVDVAPWRIPTRDELLPLIEHYGARKDSPYPLQVSYWTSTRSGSGQHHVIRIGDCAGREGCSRLTIERWSRNSAKRALAILVRDEGADSPQALERLLKGL